VSNKVTINEAMSMCQFHAEGKGFQIDPAHVDTYLLLAVSEICEAQNERRDGHGLDEIYFTDSTGMIINEVAAGWDVTLKPEGFPIEIVDAIIRLMHLYSRFRSDLEDVLMMKLKYNSTRPPKHGRKF
jgi:hypothetical protein